MKKFKVTVTREDSYIIEIDENKFNDQWIDEWKQVYYDFDTLEEHVEHIAQCRARFQQEFIEGYGAPLINGEKPIFTDDKNVEKGINIKVISEDDDIETDSYEID